MLNVSNYEAPRPFVQRVMFFIPCIYKLADILDGMAFTDDSGTNDVLTVSNSVGNHTEPPEREPLGGYCYSIKLSTFVYKRSSLSRNFSLIALIFSELEFQSVLKCCNLQGQTTVNKQSVTKYYVENHTNSR
jgi:hypothetical protein